MWNEDSEKSWNNVAITKFVGRVNILKLTRYRGKNQVQDDFITSRVVYHLFQDMIIHLSFGLT